MKKNSFLQGTSLSTYALICFFIFTIVYVVLYRQNSSTPKNKIAQDQLTSEQMQSADTFIPAGHVLVPIVIENTNSLSGLMSDFAVVNLYIRNSDQTWKLVVERAKLIRAPLDQNQYAVLLREEQAQDILNLNSAFWVVLQNRTLIQAKTEVLKQIESVRPEPSVAKKTFERATRKKTEKLKQKVLIEYQM